MSPQSAFDIYADPGHPSWLALAGEMRAPVEWLSFWVARAGLIAELPRGKPQNILVLPGFLASDLATQPLRGVLEDLGHQVHGWGLGHNMGVRPGLIPLLERKFQEVAAKAQTPVTLVGWSLGGLLAMELAQRFSTRVAQVITLGSPVSGHLKANFAWPLYEKVAGHKIDSPPIDWQPGRVPPVPVLAIAARGDGVVHPKAARLPPQEGVENSEISGTHCGLCCNPEAIRLIAHKLAQLG